MKNVAEFQSRSFAKYPNEDDEIVNPGCWGMRLAEYLRDRLPDYGVKTLDILPEDWGWIVFVDNPDFSLWIGCGVQIDQEDASGIDESLFFKEGENHQFAIFTVAEPNLIQKFIKRVNTAPAVDNLARSIKRMMEDNCEFFQEIDWSAD